MTILAGMLASCDRPAPKEAGTRNVSLATPIPMEQASIRNYPGIVREAHTVSLAFKTAGQIERILVQEGDYVKKGQLLAILDDADYKLGVAALQIQYDQLADEVGRTRKLFEKKGVSANDFEKASAGLEQLGVQLQVEKNRLGYTRLYSPADGYVQTVNFSPAEMVDAGTAVMSLLDISHMEVETDIPTDEYRRRERFTSFTCRTASGDAVTMRLLSLTPKADGNQLYRMRLAFNGQPGKQLTAGMNVEVGICMTDSQASRRLAIPLRSVFQADGKPCVWVFRKDSTVAKRTVALSGTDAEGRAVVSGGLSGGEQIVRAGVHALQDGQRVGVLEKPSETNVGGLL